jgi:hypothetical protein
MGTLWRPRTRVPPTRRSASVAREAGSLGKTRQENRAEWAVSLPNEIDHRIRALPDASELGRVRA